MWQFFLGLSNVRQQSFYYWKVSPGTNILLAYFAGASVTKETKFYNIDSISHNFAFFVTDCAAK
jgi:hypothetical protein